jgi:hypothetical protein
MKKLLPCLLFVVLLAGCVLPSSTSGPKIIQPTLSDSEMQTQIAMVMTAMPTATVMAQVPPTNTSEPVVATATLAPDQPTNTVAPPEPTQTVAPPQPTNTTEATQAPTATAGPSLTPVPGDPRGRLGSATSTDGMTDGTSWIWPTGLNDFTSMSYSGGLMTLTGLTDKLGWRLANPEGTDFGSIYLETTFKTGTCSGADQYGMIVRVPVLKDADRGYLMGFRCDGKYSLRKWDGTLGTKGTMTRLKDWTDTDAVVKGSNQVNRMGLMMVGSRLIMYANGHLLGEVSDSTWTSGHFGIYVGAGPTKQFAVQVDEMSYWKNPTP